MNIGIYLSSNTSVDLWYGQPVRPNKCPWKMIYLFSMYDLSPLHHVLNMTFLHWYSCLCKLVGLLAVCVLETSLRRTSVVLLYVIVDVAACEYINNIKRKGDFEEQLHTEHCNLNVYHFLIIQTDNTVQRRAYSKWLSQCVCVCVCVCVRVCVCVCVCTLAW